MIVALAAAVAAGCSSTQYQPAPLERGAAASTPPSSPVAVESPDRIGNAAATAALRMIGAPYRYGGASAAGFDCSGLVQFAYRAAGVELPRTTESQLATADEIDISDRRTGDLLFFRIESKISHVAIYVGDGEFVHAPSTGKSVGLATLGDSYWRERLVHAGRIR